MSKTSVKKSKSSASDSNAEVYTTLEGSLLIAMPSLHDGVFDRSVIYICQHDEEGTMGLVINQPLDDVDFEDIADGMDIDTELLRKQPIVFNGGPVENNRGFVLHSPDYKEEDTLLVAPYANLSASAHIVSEIAHNRGPKQINFCLGYAGWEAGQLEEEIADNCWMLVPADEDLLFNIPHDKRYAAAVKKVGGNVGLFVNAIGQA